MWSDLFFCAYKEKNKNISIIIDIWDYIFYDPAPIPSGNGTVPLGDCSRGKKQSKEGSDICLRNYQTDLFTYKYF